jgi:hypothetical protein
VSEQKKRAKREEAFTLSMVDLFGCGFIAAVFLFILNMLQPQIEAAEAEAAGASSGSGRQGDGRAGPLLLTIKSQVALHFPGWPPRIEPPQTTVRGFSAEDTRFKFVYDQVLLDASALPWPLRFSICAKADSPEPACAKPAAGQFDVTVRATVGNSTAAAYLLESSIGDPVTVSFEYKTKLVLKVDKDYEHFVAIGLSPKQRDNASYTSFSAAFSSAPFVAAVGWAGGVNRVAIHKKEGPSELQQSDRDIANCWLFAFSGLGTDRLECLADPTALPANVANEPWRSGIFAQRTDTCDFPFSQYVCTDSKAAPPSIPAPTARRDRCGTIDIACLVEDAMQTAREFIRRQR